MEEDVRVLLYLLIAVVIASVMYMNGFEPVMCKH
jgi:hypothetical protein